MAAVFVAALLPFTASEVTAQVLPSPWSVADVGKPLLPGTATFATPSFALTTSGFDVNGTSDQFTFAYVPIRDDVTIIARLTAVTALDPWAQAGVMIREGTGARTRHAFVFGTPGRGVALRSRSSRGGATTQRSGGSGAAPVWLKLERRGSTLTASRSADGAAWTTIQSLTVSMSSSALAGLAVASHSSIGALAASFDNVSVNGVTWGIVNLPPTVSMTAPANGATFAAPATITLTANAADADGSVQKVDFYVGATLVATDTISPYSATWPAVVGSHSVRAVATDNRGAVTNSAWRNFSVTGTTTLLSRAIFRPASPVDTVDYYVLEVFPAGADPSVALPVATQLLGLPAVVAGECSADVRATILGLAPGSYVATVASIGDAGKLRSNTFAFTR